MEINFETMHDRGEPAMDGLEVRSVKFTPVLEEEKELLFDLLAAVKRKSGIFTLTLDCATTDYATVEQVKY